VAALREKGQASGSPAGPQLIERYGGGGFMIAGTRHSGSVLILPDRTLSWPVGAAGDISLLSLAEVVRRPDRARILVVGCGRTLVSKPSQLDTDLRAAGIGLEWMDTGAACRTFNVLLLDQRPVAAALIAID
jgi:uncharacterized protein